MARKRMFDNDIISKDSFLDLPTETKALYFLLGMEADDEGFVSPKKVMRLHGIPEDNLKILIAKNYVIQFDSGVIVITDWKRNNYLDRNKIKPTIYVDEKEMLDYDEMKQQYILVKSEFNESLTKVKPKLNQSLTKVNEKLTQYRVEENSIEENSIDGEKKKATAAITKCYEENIGMITPAAADKLFSYLDDFTDYNIIIKAIEKAALNNKRSTSYICGILESWRGKGYKVLADLTKENKPVKQEINHTETAEEKLARRVKELEEAYEHDEYAGIFTSNR